MRKEVLKKKVKESYRLFRSMSNTWLLFMSSRKDTPLVRNTSIVIFNESFVKPEPTTFEDTRKCFKRLKHLAKCSMKWFENCFVSSTMGQQPSMCYLAKPYNFLHPW